MWFKELYRTTSTDDDGTIAEQQRGMQQKRSDEVESCSEMISRLGGGVTEGWETVTVPICTSCRPGTMA